MASLEGFKNFASGLSALAVPVAVAVVGGYYSTAIKEREVSVKFMELAIQILSKEPTKADAGIRLWATKILDQYSGISFDQATREDIINRVPLPKIVDTPLGGTGVRQLSNIRQVVRIIVLDTQQDDVEKEMDGLKAGGVAYHYFILKDGVIRRLADENSIAYHTPGSNADSIGIGLMHVSGSEYTQEQIEALTGLVSEITKRRNMGRTDIFAASDVDVRKRSDFPKIREKVLARAFEK